MESSRTNTLLPPVLSKEDVDRYAGQWVLLRDGRVLAASEDLAEVRTAWREQGGSVGRVPRPRQVF